MKRLLSLIALLLAALCACACAADAGVFPVWYDSDAAVRSEENAVAREQGAPVECLHIRDWNELIEKLEAL